VIYKSSQVLKTCEDLSQAPVKQCVLDLKAIFVMYLGDKNKIFTATKVVAINYLF
jgi:phage gp37-like protein